MARRPDGGLAGFVGVWDQSAIKRLRVTGYSRKLGAVRRVFNALGPLVGGTRLPASRRRPAQPDRGAGLRAPRRTPACCGRSSSTPTTTTAGGGSRSSTSASTWPTRWPSALKGLLAQPTDIWVCVAFLEDPPPGLVGDGRPTHHEIALV